MKKRYVFLAACLLSALFATRASAQEAIPNVYISEINWAGSSLSTADEWIELFNGSSESVDLGAWVLTGAATSGDALAIADGFIAAPQSTVLISNYGLGHEKTTLAIEPNLVTTALSLPNSGLSIMLVMPSGIVVDEATGNIGSSSTFISMTRQTDGTFAESTSSQGLSDTTQLGSPGAHGSVEIVETPVVDETPPIEPVVEDPMIEPEPQASPDPSITGGGSIDHPPAMGELEGAIEPEQIIEIEAPIEEASIEYVEEPAEPIVPVDEPVAEPEVLIEEPAVIEPSVPVEAAPEPTIEPVVESESRPEPIPPAPEIASFSAGALLINEIVSHPADGIEFIELYNPGEAEIDLTGWSVKDFSGKLTLLEGSVEKNSYFVIENPKGKLNNDGDEVILLDPNGNVIDQTSYGENSSAPDAGESLARLDSSFSITTTITKGSQNIFPEPEVTTAYENDLTISPVEAPSRAENEPEVVQDDLKTDVGGTEDVPDDATVHHVVAIATPANLNTTKASTKSSTKPSSSKSTSSLQTVTGMVTALPGTFGTQIAFINGVQLYFYDADWPTLTIGDVVSVRGTPSSSHGEPRIKIANAYDISILRHEDPVPVTITANDLSSQKEGVLVSVTGRIVEQNDDRIVLQDDSGELTVVAHKNAGIEWYDYSGEVTVIGIVRRFDDGAVLYPRSPEDVTMTPSTVSSSSDEIIAPVARSKPIYPWIGGGLTVAALGAIAYWYLSSRGKGSHMGLPLPSLKPNT